MAKSGKVKRRRATARAIAEHAVKFFNAGGVPASVATGGKIRVGERVFEVAPDAVDLVGVRNRWFAALVIDAAGDRLADNARRNLAPALGSVTVRAEERVLVVEHDGRAVAVIAGRSAMTGARAVIRGNFLKAHGQHWNSLVKALMPAPPPPTPLEEIVAFFTDGAIEASVEGPDAVRLAGALFSVPAAVRVGRWKARRRWIDSVVASRFRAELQERVERQLPLAAPGLELEAWGDGLAILRGALRLASIHASRATVPGAIVDANFLAPGNHWAKLAAGLEQATQTGPALHGIARLDLPWKKLESASTRSETTWRCGGAARPSRP
ncbi:MAG TPA: hypothetical protein VFG79_21505 [Solirubrobacter sp.]|nr:hypothetical protein [Solirubrobacter sp.]